MTTPPPTIERIRCLADDLIRELSTDLGDQEAINSTLRHWLEVLEPQGLGFVCMAAIQTVFTDCLTRLPIADLPPRAITYDERTVA